MNTKTQEVPPNVAITENKSNISDKLSRYTRVSVAFPDKVASDIDYFSDWSLIQCSVPVVKIYFCRLLRTNGTNDK